jgi:hypothetical protein
MPTLHFDQATINGQPIPEIVLGSIDAPREDAGIVEWKAIILANGVPEVDLIGTFEAQTVEGPVVRGSVRGTEVDPYPAAGMLQTDVVLVGTGLLSGLDV